MWFTFHIGAINYPIKASAIVSEGMKGFLKGIPYMLPCEGCRKHAIEYIYCDKIQTCLDDIVSGRDELFKFFVTFHNEVNKRYGKKQISYDDAYKMYSPGISVNKLSYK